MSVNNEHLYLEFRIFKVIAAYLNSKYYILFSPNSTTILHTTSVFSHTCQPDLGKITLIDSSDAISTRLTTPSHCAKVNS